MFSRSFWLLAFAVLSPPTCGWQVRHVVRRVGPRHLPPLLTGGKRLSFSLETLIDWEPPPGLTPDIAVLLWYYGWSTVFRSAAYRFQLTGLPFKRFDEFGLDLHALNNALGGGAALALTWSVAGLLTRVLERNETRYDPVRLLLTWLMAAPSAQALKYVAGWNAGDGSFKSGDAITDVSMTLVLMYGLRVFEEEGYL